MSAIEPLCHLIGVNSINLSKEENILLEIELFFRLCEELKEIFRQQYEEYFYLMKFNRKMENTMLESKFLSFIIQDILSTSEYSLQGIAYYAHTHEDVLYEIFSEQQSQPSAYLFEKLLNCIEP